MEILLISLIAGSFIVATLSIMVFIAKLAIVVLIAKVVTAIVKLFVALLSLIVTVGLVVTAFWFSVVAGSIVALLVVLVFYSQVKGK